jgi:hypothetical protein
VKVRDRLGDKDIGGENIEIAAAVINMKNATIFILIEKTRVHNNICF